MKYNFLKTALLLFGVLLSLNGCSDDNNSETSKVEKLTEKQKLMQEASKLLGKILTNNDVKNTLNQKMSEVGEDADIVSFAYLFNQENGLKNNEVSVFSRKSINSSTQNIFKTAMQHEFEINGDNYKTISKTLELNKSTNVLARASEAIADDLAALLVSEELQIFYPYDPEYEDDDTSVEEFYVSYDPLNNSDTNLGYKLEVGISDIEQVDGLNNDFLDSNPVYVIVPIDPCDFPGAECNITELLPVVEDPIDSEILPPSLNQFLTFNPVGIVANSPFPTPTTTLLTTNTNHNNIPESDIISSYIPRIKINGTSWMGFGGTHQKLRFYRGTTDGAVTQNADGTITASGNKYTVKDFKCKRKYLKRKLRWLSFDAEFDPDWNMTENTQVMAVFSLHHLAATASAELNAKSGFKIENGAIVPSVEASGSVKINVSVGSAKFRANAEMSRRMILATIVGTGTTGRTITDGGIQYNVKRIGIVDYYFKHYYTDL